MAKLSGNGDNGFSIQHILPANATLVHSIYAYQEVAI
jgi:hypothetical protein